MRRVVSIAALCFLNGVVYGAPLIPTTPGTTWDYNAKDESGGGGVAAQSQVENRISGTQQFNGRDVLRLETLVDGVATKTQLITVDRIGISQFAFTDKNRTMVGFISPQVIVPAKLKKGTTWDCMEEIEDLRLHQHFTVTEIETVSVPAGIFQGFRLHCEKQTPMSITIDRWFAIGTGIVKEIATFRSPTGDLLHRRTLELARGPGTKANAAKEKTVKKLLVSVSSQPVGGADETEFPSTTQNIYARWQGQLLRNGARVRAVWIAENVGEVAPPNYKIDEASAVVVNSSDAHGKFTLSRPDDGWAPGNYRVEFYLDDTLVDTIKLIIR
jgi:hypothetical protein